MKYTISLSILFLMSVQLSYAQIIDRTEERAKQKADNRVDRKIDQGLDKGFDAIEGLFGKKKKKKKNSDEAETVEAEENTPEETPSEAQSNAYSKIFGGGDVNVEDNYTFDHNILLNIESYDKKGKPEGENDMRMYFSESTPHFGMKMNMEDKGKSADSFIIYDMKTYEMVNLMNQDGQKIGMAMKFNPENFDTDSESDAGTGSHENVRFEKTGKTKMISGHSCDEYKVVDPDADSDYESFVWVTKDLDANWMGMMSDMMATNKKMKSEMVLPESYPDGTVIQIVNKSTKNDEKTVMTVKEINKNQKKTISTTGYQMMSFPTGRN